ncbi:hypothetical protein KAH55_00330, partial [bacterium]|nr:hypothetical protein [bacterium]
QAGTVIPGILRSPLTKSVNILDVRVKIIPRSVENINIYFYFGGAAILIYGQIDFNNRFRKKHSLLIKSNNLT